MPVSALRVAAFQRRPRFDDVAATVAGLLDDLEWCDAHGIDLAVFPECFLQGYGLDRALLLQRGLELHGAGFAAVRSALAQVRATVVLGMVERQGEDLYNTAAVLGWGRLRGTYRKTHPNERAFDVGTGFPVFGAAGWTFGINICNDANYPEAARRVADQGARVLAYPLNNMLPPDVAARWRERSPENLVRRAAENRCWVVSSDVVGYVDGWMSYGCTCIVDPGGNVVARVGEEQEGVAVHDLTWPA